MGDSIKNVSIICLIPSDVSSRGYSISSNARSEGTGKPLKNIYVSDGMADVVDVVHVNM